MANRQGFFIPDFRLNVRFRDFFLDFLACIVPGLIFIITVTTLIGGLLFVFGYDIFNGLSWKSPHYDQIVKNIIGSFSFSFWLILTIIFISYFVGHLLYRQTPKRPDYASFLRIRENVIKEKNDWVIEKGRGVRTEDVQFPYTNLKKYLESRGFSHLSDYIKWIPETYENKDTIDGQNAVLEEKKVQRTKTIINKAKIRISFFLPYNTINLIRNEAHIRLASSMWYAAKYTLTLSYFILFFLIIHLTYNNLELPVALKPLVLLISLIILFLGRYYRREASAEMKKYPPDLIDECEARKNLGSNLDYYNKA